MKKNIITKADIILAVILAALCAAVCICVWSEGGAGSSVEISVDGKLYGTYSLQQDQEIGIDSEYGHNTLTIRGGKALMTEASCPDGYCLGQHREDGGIDESNQTIICLPNRVSVTVRTDEEDVGKASPEESGNRSVPDAVVGTADGAAGSEGGGTGSGDGENR